MSHQVPQDSQAGQAGAITDPSQIHEIDLDKYNFTTDDREFIQKYDKGLSKKVVIAISHAKNEPEWMLQHRLKCYDLFVQMPMPKWGADLSKLDFNEMSYFIKSGKNAARDWKDVPPEIKETFDRLGIPEMEQRQLGGSVVQYESESIYFNLKKEIEDMGVIFMDLDSAIKRHPDLVRKYFMRGVPATDNKFAALHGAVWSGGSFMYVPAGVKVDKPLQTYFRMNAEAEGQFEHTLIVVEEGAQAHYIEGCTAPKYTKNSLHSAIVEIFVKKGAKARYTTVQNWSKNVYNLNTKRALVEEDGQMEWVGGSLGSYITMLYPCTVLRGDNSSATHLNIAFGSGNTWKDGGAKVIHIGKNTTSKIIAKSISMGGGTSVYRGLVRMNKGALNAKSHVQCDALILDDHSRSDTYPHNEIYEPTGTLAHEASVGKISEEQLFYLKSRGLSEAEAKSMIILGFLDDVLKEIPMEFSVEMNRLVNMEMEKLGSVG